jgi:hypothetical protein
MPAIIRCGRSKAVIGLKLDSNRPHPTIAHPLLESIEIDYTSQYLPTQVLGRVPTLGTLFEIAIPTKVLHPLWGPRTGGRSGDGTCSQLSKQALRSSRNWS